MILPIFAVCLPLLVCAAVFLRFLAARRAPQPEAHREDNCVRLDDPARQILWDIADGGKGPVVKEGTVYLDRRRFGSRIAAAAVALIGISVANKVQIKTNPRGSASLEQNRGRFSDRDYDDSSKNPIIDSGSLERNRGRYSDRDYDDSSKNP